MGRDVVIECRHTAPATGAFVLMIAAIPRCPFCELDELREERDQVRRLAARYFAALDQHSVLEESGRLHNLQTADWEAVYRERDDSAAALRKAVSS